MAIINSTDLAKALKNAPTSLSGITALDANSFLCQNPANAIQVLRSIGYQIVVTSDAEGNALYAVSA